jgi:hypothetical protein
MGSVFLGKWWHWLILILVCGLLWYAGYQRLHVIHFNVFISILVVGTVIVVIVLLAGTRPGEQVTRDKLDDNHGG